VGDITGTTEYSPVTLHFTTLSSSTDRNVGVSVIDDRHPQDLASSTTDYLSRYWAVTASSTAGNTVTATFSYTDADVNGTEANLAVNRFYATDGAWTEYTTTEYTTTVDESQNAITTTGVVTLIPTVAIASPTLDFTGRRNNPVYYRSVATGNWNDATKWEVSSDPAFLSPAPVAAAVPPSHLNADGIQIAVGHIITVSAAQTADDLTVNGTMIIASGILFTLNNDTESYDMTVNGTVINQSTSAHAYNGIVLYNAGSLYRHDVNGGLIPAEANVDFDAASTVELTGVTTGTAITNLGVNGRVYGNFTYNSLGQTVAVFNLAFPATVRINGNFRVQETNGQAIAFHSGTASTVHVLGDFLLEKGTLYLNNSGTTVTSFALYGNYVQSVGTTFAKGGSTGAQEVYFRGTNKTYTNAGTVTNTLINYRVDYDSNYLITLPDFSLNSPMSMAPSRTFNVNAGTLRLNGNNITFENAGSMSVTGTLMCGTAIVTNTAGATTFTLASGGTLGIGSPDGITASGATGNIQVSSTRTYNSSSNTNFIYDGSVAQVTGAALPATVNNLTINNTATGKNGVSLTTAGNVAVSTSLNLQQGLLYLNERNLSLN